MKLEKISLEQYQLFLQGKPNVSMQMLGPMVKLYEQNGWTCIPIGLYEQQFATKVVVSFDTIDSQPQIESQQKLVGVGMLCGKPVKLAGMNYSLQYGPYLDYNNEEVVYQFFKQLKPLLKSLKASSFSCNPNVVQTTYDLSGNVIETNNTFTHILDKLGYKLKDKSIDTNGKIDMRYFYKKNIDFKDIEQLRGSYTARARREVCNGINNLVEIVEAEGGDYQVVEQLMTQSADKHGYRMHGIEYYKNLKQLFGDDAYVLLAKIDSSKFIDNKTAELDSNLKLIESYNGNNRKGRITKLEEQNSLLKRLLTIVEKCDEDTLYLSAGVYIKTMDQLIHFLSGNDNSLSKFNGSSVMQDYAMQLGMANNLKIFNMYGVSGSFDKDDSVFKFKTGFDGYVEELCGTYTYILAPTKLKFVNILKKVLRKN